MYLPKAIMLVVGLLLIAYENEAQNNHMVWEDFDEAKISQTDLDRRVTPHQYRTIKFEKEAIEELLLNAPVRFSDQSNNDIILNVPLPNGRSEDFKIYSAPVMHPDLAIKYPEITSYTGSSIHNSANLIRITLNEEGIFAMVLSPEYGTVRIRPFAEELDDIHICFNAADINPAEWEPFKCHTHHFGQAETMPEQLFVETDSDCNLRRYDLAIACSGEYTGKHGGSVAGALAAINVVVGNLNLLYERDAGITFELISDNDEIIFTNPATDPYTNESAMADISANQTTMNNIIGTENYDIGHLLTTNGGGLAGIGSVCKNNWKARGESGSGNPEGYYFETIVQHEIGHQFSARHAQNNDCNYNPVGGVEPGSGSSLMGYAGVCSPNIQFPADDYYNGKSLEQILTFTQGGPASTCAHIIEIDNLAPEVDAGNDYYIPSDTYFKLEGSATNPDNDAQLFNWEQMDPEQGEIQPPSPENTQGPMFRSWEPTVDAFRYFPELEDIIANHSPNWEVLPGTDRIMNFRLSVRDIHEGIGCIQQEDVILHIVDTAEDQGFEVLYPSAAETLYLGEATTITWNPVGSFEEPINCEYVDIYLSLDGGWNFPILLAENVPNQPGSYELIIPNDLPQGINNRIKIACSDNIFFDMSDEDFALEIPQQPTFYLEASPEFQSICGEEVSEIVFQVGLSQFLIYNEEINFSVEGLPDGVLVDFSSQNVLPPAEVDLTISGLAFLEEETYNMTITASSSSFSRDIQVSFDFVPAVPTEVINLIEPIDGIKDLPVSNSTLKWEESPEVDEYEIQIATNPAFGNSIIVSTITESNEFIPTELESFQIYYWRVRGRNLCGGGVFSSTYSFETEGRICERFSYEGEEIVIPSFSSNPLIQIEVPLNISVDREIFDINVINFDLEHSWPGDMGALLVAPDESWVQLFHRPGIPNSSTGCSNNDILCDFDDEAELSYEDLEGDCNGTPPSVWGTYQPQHSLSLFDGKSTYGDWILVLEDYFPSGEGGLLKSWELDICTGTETAAPPILIKNEVLFTQAGTEKAISNLYLETSDSVYQSHQITFTILQLPENGYLINTSDTLDIGGQFTQEDIDSNNLAYHHDGSLSESDFFRFDIRNDGNGWIPNQIFEIQINQAPAVLADLIKDISCNNANDAEIAVEVYGGTPPYEYSLDGQIFQVENNFDNLPEGTYIVYVQDNGGFEIQSNEIIISNPDPLVISATVNNFEIEIEATGGTGDLLYSLNGTDFQESSILQGTAPGDYEVTVMDQNACTEITEVSLVFNASLNIEEELSCYNGNDGVISIEVVGGSGNFSYSIDGMNFQEASLFENLEEGIYQVQVKDEFDNIVLTNQVELENPNEILGVLSVDSFEISINATGGTGTLLFSIDGINFQEEPLFQVNENGIYNVIIQDENACQKILSATVAVNTMIVSAVQQENVSCHGEWDASIEVIVGGGMPPYQYSMNGSTFQTESVFNNLPAGIYQVEVMDAEGFTSETNEVEVFDPTILTGSVEVSGFEITINAAGGTGDLSYSIDGQNFQENPVFLVSENGNYEIIIQDENGCQELVTANISVNTLIVSAIQQESISCSGAWDASIEVIVNGGTAPYQYSLNGSAFQNEPIFNNLPAGNYQIEVLDAEGFSLATNVVEIIDPPVLTATAEINGFEITINASGGTGVYEYAINDEASQTQNIFLVDENGTYNILIQDENGCQTSIEAIVLVNTLIVKAKILTDLSCYNSNDGSFEVIVLGGTPPFQYSLNGGAFQDENTFENLTEGTYSVEVIDADGFSLYTNEVVLVNPLELIAMATTSGYDIVVEASGGAGNYEYSLDGLDFQQNPIFSNLPNGSYEITIQDSEGCIVQDSVDLFVLALSGELVIENPITCYNETDGVLALSVDGGVPPYLYSLNGGTFTDNLSLENLSEGTYQLIIQDAGGITFETQEIVLENPQELDLTYNSFDNNIQAIASGGTGTYQFSIDGQNYQIEDTFYDLPNGYYDLYVMDEQGCVSMVNIALNLMNIDEITQVDNLCNGEAEGSLSICISGGEGPFTVELEPQAGTISSISGDCFENILVSGLPSGNYVASISDQLGAYFEYEIEIGEPSSLNIETALTENQLLIAAFGGTPPYQYSINGIDFFENPLFEDLPNGNYDAIVMDANGCLASETIVVNSIYEQYEPLRFRIFPNPNDGNFFIEYSNTTHDRIELMLFNVVGKLVYQKEFEANEWNLPHFIQLMNLPMGMYELKIRSGDKIGFEKIIVKH